MEDASEPRYAAEKFAQHSDEIEGEFPDHGTKRWVWVEAPDGTVALFGVTIEMVRSYDGAVGHEHPCPNCPEKVPCSDHSCAAENPKLCEECEIERRYKSKQGGKR